VSAGAGPSGLAPGPLPGSGDEPVAGPGAGLVVVVVDAAADTACAGGWLAGWPECHAVASGAGVPREAAGPECHGLCEECGEEGGNHGADCPTWGDEALGLFEP